MWIEGQLIRPQHFQQQERWVEHLVETRSQGVRRHGWGVRSMGLDRDLLTLGKVSLSSFLGIMPDGTVLDLPRQSALPAARTAPAGLRNALVKLAVPMRQVDGAELATEQGSTRRYVVLEQDARDTTSPDRPASPLKIGGLNLSLLFEGEPEDNLVTMPIAQIEEVDPAGAIKLSSRYIPPCLDIRAAERLIEVLNETRALIKSRADALAQRADATRSASDGAGLLDMLILTVLNGEDARFDHLAQDTGVHPDAVFEAMLSLTARLATFGGNRRKPADLPSYRHDDLQLSFFPLIERLREFLAVVTERNAVPLDLQQRGYGILTAIISDRTLFQDARFVLTAVASIPSETLRVQLPQQLKIGSVEQIRDLVNLQLPGIPVKPLSVAPQELPFLQNGVYFELDQNAELWRNLLRSAAFAFHVSGEYPDLHLEFWAIRRKRS